MQSQVLSFKGIELSIQDYRNSISDYRMLNDLDFDGPQPAFIPEVDEAFFAGEGFVLPVVKLNPQSYIFPTNARKKDKSSTPEDYEGYCVTNLDLLVITQNYYYYLAKKTYEMHPDIHHRMERVDGKLTPAESVKGFRKRNSGSMTWVQFNLASIIHEKSRIWPVFHEMEDEIKFKKSDIKLQIEENENTYSKGEQSSYGRTNIDNILLPKFGVQVKLQNGEKVLDIHVNTIRNCLSSFFETVVDLSELFRNYGLMISFAQDKYMHERDSLGVFHPRFKAIGISNIGDVHRTAAHEFGHFIDYHLGQLVQRNYASDDNSALAGQIGVLFRKNMRKKQLSAYQNRTVECFARAMEQYYCLLSSHEMAENQSNFCDHEMFLDKIVPLIRELLQSLVI